MKRLKHIYKFLDDLFPSDQDKETIVSYMRDSLIKPEEAKLPLCLVWEHRNLQDCSDSLFIDFFQTVLRTEFKPLSTNDLVIFDSRTNIPGTFSFNSRWAGHNVIAINEIKIEEKVLEAISSIIQEKEIQVHKKLAEDYLVPNCSTWILISETLKNFDNFNALYEIIRMGNTEFTWREWNCIIEEIPGFVFYLKNNKFPKKKFKVGYKLMCDNGLVYLVETDWYEMPHEDWYFEHKATIEAMNILLGMHDDLKEGNKKVVDFKIIWED